MNVKEDYMYCYKVDCWIPPSSGKDIIRKNKVIRLMKKAAQNVFPNDHDIHEAIERYNKTHENMILESFLVESDTEIKNYEKEIMPKLLQTFSTAKFVSCTPILNFGDIADGKKSF